ncbi:MAG TPA: arylamine N-acetyltransferase [Pyrinomonadaceae bacterium]|jgi:N-hydroxyarylamine O-acetyltransferase
MNKNEYLSRIGIERTNIEPTLQNLKFLQRRHLLRVPFENLDIHWRRLIKLDKERFYKKIVGENRGGFCYELNGLFYELLGEINFQSEMISAKVSKGGGEFGEEFDHLAILTQIDEKKYLVDVGFGDFTAEPLEFVLETEQKDRNGIFFIRKYDENYFEVVKKDGDEWKSEYVFTVLPRALNEFAEMCLYQQTSPESHFTRGKVCSLMTENGRKTLTDKSFIETKYGEKTETDINSDEVFNRILAREFHIERKF